ncbi:MAG TPA: bifunctional diguanylate cyclase/phosphodiesterase [Dermatophilaceae bacterium]|nr:bifunctional diguanylate cyclase/phosphodiesterase [Dermatophilaceae bacterium]
MKAVLAVVVTACAVAYAVDPHGVGRVAFVACAGASLLGIAVGPVLRGARPVRLFLLSAVGVSLFLASFLIRVARPATVGPFKLADLVCFLGDILLISWLAGFLRLSAARGDQRLWLDIALVALGAGLALWAVTVSPSVGVGAQNLVDALVVAAYSIFDVTLLALTVQLLFRAMVRVPALWALVWGLAVMLTLDTVYAVAWTFDADQSIPAVTALYLYAYGLCGYGACHRTVCDLAQGDEVGPVRRSAGSRQGALLLSMVLPVVISTVCPIQGSMDAAVRVALLVALFALIYLRLTSTMSALSRSEDESRRRALRDALTGLPNRVALTGDLERWLASPEPSYAPWVSVLFIDCDHFKQVNDTWGHPVGDAVLVEVASRLSAVIREEDVLARVGGDEFLIIARTGHAGDATVLAGCVIEAFAEPMELVDDHTVQMTPSVGVAQATAGSGVRAHDLIRDADIALYTVKANGRAGWTSFDESLRQQVSERVLLAEALRGAVAHDEIDVYFQPIMGGPGYATLLGWEALARWHHPDEGLISPDVFIPIAEDTSVILEIGAYMLTRACDELVRLREESGRADLHVSVNVSPVQMVRGGLPRLLESVLARTGLPPEALWLEITESIIVERGAQATTWLSSLHELGVTLCMDDFGTGYSSLGTLHEFPLDIVKVDRSFVRDLAVDTRAVAVARAIVDMVEALGLTGVVAEGVETPEQAAELERLGCTMVQGFLYGRPSPTAQLHLTPSCVTGAGGEAA